MRLMPILTLPLFTMSLGCKDAVQPNIDENTGRLEANG
jgi:hypothetical protein